MAQAVPNATPGSVIFTYDAPYSVYLRTLEDQWKTRDEREASNQWEEVRDLAHVLECARNGLDCSMDLLPSSKSVAIIDIAPGERGNEVVTVAQLDYAKIPGEHPDTINYQVADEFLNSLRTCTTDIHTRILVLQDCQPWQPAPGESLRFPGKDWAFQTLFNIHLLGIELDLAPAHVCFLMRQYRRESCTRRYLHPTLVDTCVNFETIRDEPTQPEKIYEIHGRDTQIWRLGHRVQRDNIALSLGRKRFGDGSPHTGNYTWSSHRKSFKLTALSFYHSGGVSHL